MNNQIQKIKEIISLYKNDFETVNKQERYKWEAVQWYQEHWDIDAHDFGSMVENAFSKAGNLLTSGKTYTAAMTSGFAKDYPEEARNLFKILYDNNLSFKERFNTFRQRFEQWIDDMKKDGKNLDKNLSHYQDLHAISVYLTFEYPETYSIYKYSVFNEFCKRIGFEIIKTKDNENIWKFENFNRLCELVLSVVKEDEELIQMNKDRLDDTCYQGEGLRLLVQDVIYYGGRYLETEIDYSKYWPSKEEYDPGLTSEQWKEFILNVELPNHPCPMQMLKAMMDMGGEATCKQLSKKYGGTSNRYIGCTISLSKRIKSYFSLKPCMDNGVERYFAIPFLGRHVNDKKEGVYSYLIRPELLEALNEIDLSTVDLYASTDEDEDCMETKKEMVITYGEKTDIKLNTILYGPPGTGKTYHTAYYAVAITENKNLDEVLKDDYSEVLKRYNYHKEKGNICFTTFHQSYGYEEFIEGIRPILQDDIKQGNLEYQITPGIFKNFCDIAVNKNENFVFIIDEINRGNISKIFGELITLIEDSKRKDKKEGMELVLPYSKKLFGVPKNVYILGTMNTADRSIALLDTALRRRFNFKEMLPDVTYLDGVYVEGLEIRQILEKMNKKISVLYDREHMIGHAYFKELKENASIGVLAKIFKNKIIPLLQEYFFEDYEKIRLILGDNKSNDENNIFIKEQKDSYTKLFGTNPFGEEQYVDYEINEKAFENIESYKKI